MESASDWTFYVLNDNCPDYTWGFNEQQTRKAFADIVRAHLDQMKRTDGEPPENQDRYNMAVAQEALCFIEHYPDRRDELARRVKEDRVYFSPFLCNSLWGFQSVEGLVRTLYPARRLSTLLGTPLDVAHHIEEPSLPWGMAAVLPACGIRWLLNPFLDVDSTFGGLKNPPVFVCEGPDGGQLRVVLDTWLSHKANYVQGAAALKESGALAKDWAAHYQKLGASYPLRVVLASGTHGDISPSSGDRAKEFADGIIRHNAQAQGQPKLVNATFPMFCKAVDDARVDLPAVRGCFGHSWDLWPVSLAKYAAGMRTGEQEFFAAEALLACAGRGSASVQRATRSDRTRAEWCLAMLSDHAWNGTDEKNKKVNAELRKAWAAELHTLAAKLQQEGWQAAGARKTDAEITLFNPLSFPRADLACVEWPGAAAGLLDGARSIECQSAEEDGRRVLCFVSPDVPGFGFARLTVKPGAGPSEAVAGRLRATATELESPFYRLKADPKAGGVVSLFHKASGRELLRPGRALGQTVYHDGREHALSEVTVEVAAAGPVLARWKLSGAVSGISVTNCVTVYSGLDRVDLDVRVRKPPTAQQQRLCHLFPLLEEKALLRLETTGAVVRPKPQPEGDLLPGADTRRMAVQRYADLSGAGVGVTLAPLEAFMVRLDLEGLTFEALGNDQNYKEVKPDQNGESEFRFRYALRARSGNYDPAAAFAFGRTVASPLLAFAGRVKDGLEPPVAVPGDRAVATCLKPADDERLGGVILRVWEVAGRAEPLSVGVPGFKRAVACDLLERDQGELPAPAGKLALKVRPSGFAAVRLLP